MVQFESPESAAPMNRKPLFGPRDRAREVLKPETQRQLQTVRSNVEQTRTLR